MNVPILATKFFIPLPRQDLVTRPRLIEQLNTGLSRTLALISAPAGFGKSTLLSVWAYQVNVSIHIAWLSLDEADNDLTRFLTYIVVTLQSIQPNFGQLISAFWPETAAKLVVTEAETDVSPTFLLIFAEKPIGIQRFCGRCQLQVYC